MSAQKTKTTEFKIEKEKKTKTIPFSKLLIRLKRRATLNLYRLP